MGQLTLAFDGSAEINSTQKVAPRRTRRRALRPRTEYESANDNAAEVPEHIKRTRQAIGMINVMPKDTLPSVNHVQALITALIRCGRFKNRAAVWNAMRQYPYEHIENVEELGDRLRRSKLVREPLEEAAKGTDMRKAISTVLQRHYSPHA